MPSKMVWMPEDRYVDAGGIKTRFWSLGENGPVLILLHGLGASAEIWLPNIAALVQGYRVIVPDLAGFGRSERPPHSFTPLDYVRFIDDFREAVGIKQASFLGHSLGGGVALLYALKFPGKVEKLVLVDCAGFGKEVIWTLRLMSLPGIGELASYPSRAGVALFFRLAVRNPTVITRDFVDIYYELFRQPGFSAFLLRMVRMLVDLRGGKQEILAPVLQNLDKIVQPTLIIWGENDPVFPLAHAYRGKEKIARAQLVVMGNCGHIPNVERAEAFNQVVLDSLGGALEASAAMAPPYLHEGFI